jgi:flagellar P-ring protein FlgI
MLKIILIIIMFTNVCLYANVSTKIRDIADVEGVRENQLQGFGLIVGLDGTGDSRKSFFTIQAYANMLKKYGINVDVSDLNFDNVASVMVRATLPPFVRPGQKIDVTVASHGDAENLQGGILLQTPLVAANGEVYAVAQGPVTIGGFNVRTAGARVQQNHPTVGRVINGAIIEREVPMSFVKDNKVQLLLHRADFTNVSRVTDVVNNFFNGDIAFARDASAVEIEVPEYYDNSVPAFISSLQNLEIFTEQPAKVVINPRTGTVVMGNNVRLSQVAVAHGNLNVVIRKEETVSQPSPLSSGQTTVTQKDDISVKEEKQNLMLLDSSSTISDVVGALNKIGASPRDIVSILQAMKAAGALHAELELL